MNIFKYFHNIYRGWENFGKHICLFSLFGIFSISASKYFAGILNFSYFGYAPSSEFEIVMSLIIVLFTLIYSLGYVFCYSNKLLNEGQCDLPDLNFKPFITFIKMLPIILVWGFFITLFLILGLFIFNLKINIVGSIIYYSFLLCLIPFVHVIWILYSKIFKYKRIFYSYFYIVKVIRKTLIPIVSLLVFLTPIFCILMLLPHYICIYSASIKILSLQLGIRIMALILWIYFSNIITYVYVQGLADIIKNRILFPKNE